MFKSPNLAFIPAPHASKVMLKILLVRLQDSMNQESPDVQAGFRKGRGTRSQTANICWILEKSREFQKKASTSVLLTMLKPLTVRITTNCGKFLRRWEYQTTLPVSWETCIQVKKQQLELDIEQLTGSEMGKEYNKAAHCHSARLTSMQSTSCKMLGLMNHKLESRLSGWYHSNGRKWIGAKESLEGEIGEWKSWLKTQHSKKLDHAIQPHHFMANTRGGNANCDSFSFLGLQNHCGWWLLPWI